METRSLKKQLKLFYITKLRSNIIIIQCYYFNLRKESCASGTKEQKYKLRASQLLSSEVGEKVDPKMVEAVAIIELDNNGDSLLVWYVELWILLNQYFFIHLLFKMLR